jgi:hypothetical protein
MNQPSPQGHVATGLLVGVLAALCFTAPAAALPFQSSEGRKEAARVARKVEKAAKAAARQTEQENEAVRHFQKAAAKYADLHDSLLSRLGGQKAVTAQALADAITASRVKARPGDILLPEVQPVLRRLIAEELKGPDTLAARKAVSEGNPTEVDDQTPVAVRVNAAYPVGAQRSTVPSSLLLVLPALPGCLHYRFVGRDLILVDNVAQIIVDFLAVAAPSIAVK